MIPASHPTREIQVVELSAELSSRLVRIAEAYAAQPPSEETRERARSSARGRSATNLAASVRSAVADVVGPSGTVMLGMDPALLPMVETIVQISRDARKSVSEKNIAALVEMLVAAHDPTAAVRADIDADNAAARLRFIETVPCLNSARLAGLVGHGAKNTSQTASRWKAAGRAFSVPWRGREEYPAFQFRDGRPLPIVAAILAALPKAMTPWQIAFWFVSANGWLNGRAPCDALSDGDAALDAAKQEDAAVAG